MSSDWEDEDMDSEYEISQRDICQEWNRKNAAKKVRTLQNLALKCVDKNFRRFVTAYLVSKDKIMLRSLDFLRRLYSLHFMSKLTEEEDLDPEYFDFLLNEHLKELDFAVFSTKDLNLVVQRLPDIGHSILKASFENMCYHEDTRKVISNIVCHLPNVNILNFGENCTDEILRIISVQCHNLQELYIDDSDVTSSGLKHLCNKTELTFTMKILSFNLLELEEFPMELLLENMPSLEILRHPHSALMIYGMLNHYSKQNTIETSWKCNLTTLVISDIDFEYMDFSCVPPLLYCLLQYSRSDGDMIFGPKIGDIIIACSQVCPNMTTLYVKFQTAFDLRLISRFLNLENLVISSKCTNLSLNNFLIKGGGKLKRLYIKDHLSFSATVLVESCPQLECIELKKISFESMSNAKVKQLCNLQKIVFEKLNFHQPFVQNSVNYILKCSSNLEDLSFLNCELDVSEVNAELSLIFQSSKTLKHIKFSKTVVEESFLQTIVLTWQSIKTITLNYCSNINHGQLCNLIKVAETMPNFIEIINYDRSEQNSLDNPFIHFDFDDDNSMYDSDHSVEDRWYMPDYGW